MSEKSALIVAGVIFAACVALALNYIFIEPGFIRAMFCISFAFTFYFAIRNPKFLVASSFEEMCEMYDDLRDKNFVYGATPLYPAILLVAIVYIAITKYGWPFF